MQPAIGGKHRPGRQTHRDRQARPLDPHQQRAVGETQPGERRPALGREPDQRRRIVRHPPLDHPGPGPERRQRPRRTGVLPGRHAPGDGGEVDRGLEPHRKACPGLRTGMRPFRQAGLRPALLPRLAIGLAGPDEAPGPYRIPSAHLPSHGQPLPDRVRDRLPQGAPSGPGQAVSGPAVRSSARTMAHQRALISNPSVCSACAVSLSRRVARRPKETSGALALAAGVSRQPRL